MTTTVIDCDTCPIRGHGCPDCFVSHLDVAATWLGELSVTELTRTEQEAIDTLTASGLVRFPTRPTAVAG